MSQCLLPEELNAGRQRSVPLLRQRDTLGKNLTSPPAPHAEFTRIEELASVHSGTPPHPHPPPPCRHDTVHWLSLSLSDGRANEAAWLIACKNNFPQKRRQTRPLDILLSNYDVQNESMTENDFYSGSKFFKKPPNCLLCSFLGHLLMQDKRRVFMLIWWKVNLSSFGRRRKNPDLLQMNESPRGHSTWLSH